MSRCFVVRVWRKFHLRLQEKFSLPDSGFHEIHKFLTALQSCLLERTSPKSDKCGNKNKINYNLPFSGAFAEFVKSDYQLRCACLSVRVELLGAPPPLPPTRRLFMKFDILVFVENQTKFEFRRWRHNMDQAHCMLDNTYCFSTATIVTRTYIASRVLAISVMFRVMVTVNSVCFPILSNL